MTAEHLIAVYGYAAIIIGTILEGKTVVLIAAVLASSECLSLPWVIVSAIFGSLTGDLFFRHIRSCRN